MASTARRLRSSQAPSIRTTAAPIPSRVARKSPNSSSRRCGCSRWCPSGRHSTSTWCSRYRSASRSQAAVSIQARAAPVVVAGVDHRADEVGVEEDEARPGRGRPRDRLVLARLLASGDRLHVRVGQGVRRRSDVLAGVLGRPGHAVARGEVAGEPGLARALRADEDDAPHAETGQAAAVRERSPPLAKAEHGQHQEHGVERGRSRRAACDSVHPDVAHVHRDPHQPVLEPLARGHPLRRQAEGGGRGVGKRQRGVGAVLQEEAERQRETARGRRPSPAAQRARRARHREPPVLPPRRGATRTSRRGHDHVHGLQRRVAVEAGVEEDDEVTGDA